MQFFDTHNHCLELKILNTNLIADAKQNNINKILNVATTKHQWQKIIDLNLNNNLFMPALGIHPWFVDEHTFEDLELLEKYLQKHQNVAIGEIGLDKVIKPNNELWMKQCNFFENQLFLAKKFNRSVSLHNRKNWPEFLFLLKKYQPLGVIHGFSASFEIAKNLLDLNLKIGIGTVVLLSNSHKIKNTIAKLPLDSIVLESDAPNMGFQAPLSATIKQIFTVLCTIRLESKEQIATQLWQNSIDLFAL